MSRHIVEAPIITCPQWGAQRPREPITVVGRAERIIFHHTAGHAKGDSVAQSKEYARALQAFHISRGWIDSGHNFLVCRNGRILQGRWLTVSAIEAGHMVVSAHCPGQNTQIGIEHEHNGQEAMTLAQVYAAAKLQAWIAYQYGLTRVLPVDPHSKYFATSCPANLKSQIGHIRSMAQRLLTGDTLE